jgi:ribosomal protein S18 acetylase RimI-like enzyme
VTDERINLYQRPGVSDPLIVEQTMSIVEELVGEWFTPDVPDSTRRDLQFQDVLCLEVDGRVTAFIMFVGYEGSISLTLMGTRPGARGQGLGSRLLKHLFEHVAQLGFDRIEVLTVPPEFKPCYEATVKFYQKHGFVIDKEIPGLWESCPALKLVRTLP